MSETHDLTWLRNSRVRQMERLFRQPSAMEKELIPLLKLVTELLQKAIELMELMAVKASTDNSYLPLEMHQQARPDGMMAAIEPQPARPPSDAPMAASDLKEKARRVRATDVLSPAGWRLLQILVTSTGIFLPYTELIQKAGLKSNNETNIRVHIGHVRAVLERHGMKNAIETSHKSYALRPEYITQALALLDISKRR